LDETGERVRAVRAMEALGSEVLVLQADVSDAEQMRAVVARACNAFGTVHGVIHAAGIGDTGVIARKERATALKVLEPKVAGTLQTFECVRSLEPDFFILCSSLASILSPARLSDYAAANAFQDAFAHACDRVEGTRCISINWDVWKEVGMGVTTEALPFGISNEAGCRVFDLILRNPRPQWIVSTREIGSALRQTERQVIRERPVSHASTSPQSREVGACSAREEAIRHIWSDLLGIAEPDLNADFFESGGDSLLAVQLGARLESRFETTVTLEQILRAPTIAGLARHIGV
jgi:NAD(P)-dependent dehydrogenase (short-subunit alcohol dehydrogenase family)/acyl carrier protein